MDAFCSLTGARTFVDSNLVHLEVVDGANIARYLMGADAVGLDVAQLPDVLHEAVHHWCLNSRVGLAITLARAELVEASLADPTAQRMGRCYLRYLTAVAALRPIVEGLACFAEFDVAPGHGNLRSPPLLWLARLAAPQQFQRAVGAPSTQGMDELIRSTLKEMRLLEATGRRKDTLLVQPLDPRRRGGYLTGYLLVKGLQARTAGLTDLALDSELWLSFLFAYVFGDVGLAARTLTPATGEGDVRALCGAGDHLLDRLRRLSDPAFAARSLTSYNDAFGANPAHDADEALGVTSTGLRTWDALHRPHLEALWNSSSIDAVDASRAWSRALLRTREWICVASAAGRLDIKDSGRVVFYDEFGAIRFAGPATQPGSLPTTAGSSLPAAMEFWVGPSGEGSVYVVASATGVHVQMAVWPAEDEVLEGFLGSARSSRYLIELSDWLRQVIDELVDGQPWATDARGLATDIANAGLVGQAELAVELYGGDDTAVRALWDDGFFDVFESMDLLKAVSAWGLISSTDSSSSFDPPLRLALAAARDGREVGLTLTSDDWERILV